MKFPSLISAAFDPRNYTIAASLGGEIRDAVADGEITPREIVESASAVSAAALDAYGVGDQVLVDVSEDTGGARVAACTDQVASAIGEALQDGRLTAREAVQLFERVGVAILDSLTDSPDAPIAAPPS